MAPGRQTRIAWGLGFAIGGLAMAWIAIDTPGGIPVLYAMAAVGGLYGLVRLAGIIRRRRTRL